MTDWDRFLTMSEAAGRARCPVASIRYHFDSGAIGGARDLDGRRFIDPDSLDRFVGAGLSVHAAAHRLGWSPGRVRARFDAGELAGHRDGLGRRRIDLSLSAPAPANRS
jgi:hypothetical protein